MLLLLLLVLPRARVVGIPGCAAEAAVVDEEEAGAQQEHEKHRYPMALAQRHKAHGDTRARSVRRQTHSPENFLQLVYGAKKNLEKRPAVMDGAAHASPKCRFAVASCILMHLHSFTFFKKGSKAVR